MSLHTLTVVIENLTDAQALAVEEMFAHWIYLGSVGSSRDVTFFADGDGNFRPKITVDGRPPERKCAALLGESYGIAPNGDVRIDFDDIAWKLRP